MFSPGWRNKAESNPLTDTLWGYRVRRMNTSTRLIAFGFALVLVFGAMFLAGRALVPAETVDSWNHKAEEPSMEHEAK